MKEYPSIELPIIYDVPIYMFDKIDGSNIRAEWSHKRGFYKYGSRNRLIDKSDEKLGSAVELVQKSYGTALDEKFRSLKYKRALAFFEFHGEHSFAGSHRKHEEHKVTLLDIAADNKGILPPSQFVADFGSLGIPKILYTGLITTEHVEQIKSGQMPGMTYEGVVCKADKMISPGLPIMFKIKNRNWIDTLKLYCGNDQKLFWRLV